jgi:hypothetical protein|tara:strand:+ start:222 stop:704 length:483 start_codon:yes stop_codon:yes gene_type:complete
MKTAMMQAMDSATLVRVLTTAESVAIGKAKVAKVGNENRLSVGDHQVDFTVRIQGQIRVGEDYDKAPTTSIPLLETLALTLAYAGITRDAAIMAIETALNAVMARQGDRKKGSGAILANAVDVSVIETMIDRVKDNIVAKLPRTHADGPVTTKIEVTPIA